MMPFFSRKFIILVWRGGFNPALAIGTAIIAEFIAIKLRGKTTQLSFRLQRSLTTLILAVKVFHLMHLIGSSSLELCAVFLLGKQVYGGLGQNPFNPAMIGYVILQFHSHYK